MFVITISKPLWEGLTCPICSEEFNDNEKALSLMDLNMYHFRCKSYESVDKEEKDLYEDICILDLKKDKETKNFFYKWKFAEINKLMMQELINFTLEYTASKCNLL